MNVIETLNKEWTDKYVLVVKEVQESFDHINAIILKYKLAEDETIDASNSK